MASLVDIIGVLNVSSNYLRMRKQHAIQVKKTVVSAFFILIDLIEYCLENVHKLMILWKWVTSRRVASIGCRTGEGDWQDTQHKNHYHGSNQDQLGLRVTKI